MKDRASNQPCIIRSHIYPVRDRFHKYAQMSHSDIPARKCPFQPCSAGLWSRGLSHCARRCRPSWSACTCSWTDCARRSSASPSYSSSRSGGIDSSLSAWHLRTPCTGSLPERAARCPPLRTPCTCSFPERAGRCSPLRTPCIGSLFDRAGRCSPLRTPCTRAFSDCADICPTSLLSLSFPPHCTLDAIWRRPLAAALSTLPIRSAPAA